LSPKRVALVGTTASGKSHAALGVAEALGDIELCCIDSMTLYREMDIATAKPTRSDQQRVRHHLLDLVDPGEEFSVAQFQALANEAIVTVELRTQRALLVGGTGLYLRAVIDGLEFPGRFPHVASALDAIADSPHGLARLYERLMVLDPVGARRVEPNNRRRLVRALEVTIATGRPFSSFGPGLSEYRKTDVALVGIAYDPVGIAERIEERVQAWLEAGWVDEVAALSRREGGLSLTARQALGYKEILAHIEDGEDLGECVSATIARTKNMAKRQWAWFRRDPRIVWVEPGETLVSTIASAYEEKLWPPHHHRAPKWETTSMQRRAPSSLVTFVKAHGAGNDFLVISKEDAAGLSRERVIALCDRHRGIGADGILVVGKGGETDLDMTLYNADGSIAEMSGNGIRVLVGVAVSWGMVNEGTVSVATGAGRKTVHFENRDGLGVGYASVAMGKVTLGDEVSLPHHVARGVRATVGNPHVVAVVESDPHHVDLHALVKELAGTTPLGVNVEVICARNSEQIDLVVYERGVGPTQACGTGSSAAAVVAHRLGLVGAKVTVKNPGGDLVVEIGDDDNVTLSGEAKIVGTIGVNLQALDNVEADGAR